MLSRSRPCQRSLALRQLAIRKHLPRRHATTFRSASAAPPSLASGTADTQQQRKTAGSRRPSDAHGRGFATAVDDFRLNMSNHAHAMPPLTPTSARPKGAIPYEIRPLDGSGIIRLPEVMQPKIPRLHSSAYGVPGDVEEILAIVDACLMIGMLDRAGVVIKRLKHEKLSMISRHDIMRLHNRYLKLAVEQLAASPSDAKADNIHRWYETEIRQAGFPHTAETIAYLLKAALLAHPNVTDLRLERLVTRYMGMAAGNDGLSVLYMTDILTDKDRAIITRLCSTHNIPVGDMPAQDFPVEHAAAEETIPDETTAPAFDTPDQELAGAHNTSSTASDAPDSFPQVLSVKQKGFGLESVKRSLSLFDEIPIGCKISDLPYAQRREIQTRIERDTVDAAISRWKHDNEKLEKVGLQTSIGNKSLNGRLFEWHMALEGRFKRILDEAEAAENLKRPGRAAVELMTLAPFLRQTKPSRLAAITILGVLSSMSTHGADKGVPIVNVVRQVAQVAEDDAVAMQRAMKSQKKPGRRPASASASATAAAAAAAATADVAQPMEEKQAAASSGSLEILNQQSRQPGDVVRTSSIYDHQSAGADRWPAGIKTGIGAMLVEGLIEEAHFKLRVQDPNSSKPTSQDMPAFIRSVHFRRGKRIGMLLPHKELVKLMVREPRGELLARHLPMVCEPTPWTGFDSGGYIEQPSTLVRMKGGEKDQKVYTEAAIAKGDMDQITQGLDALGKTAWRLNKGVLEVMLDVWNSGEGLAGIPPLNPDIKTPEEPTTNEDPLARRKWLKELKESENLRASMHSMRCHMNFQLEIARAYRDQTLYFPHNVDFRGRAYPIPVHLNHMGADHVRGLFLFDKGKPLGEDGLRWLKVHLANLYGFDKASLDEREAFALENKDNIMDSAKNPLGGRRWWLKAEDPWQCLATCMELQGAWDSADPTKFVSHLPVHQDGTCNGLQHYAALGGDSWGARQVNLEPGERPADVYSAVAELVDKAINEDAAAGNRLAQALVGKIKRKVVKQPVMTNVYGVTFMGAKAQVKRQLDSLYPKIKEETGIDSAFLASFVAIKIFAAMSSMFRGAHDIQHWLGEIGSRVCRAITPDQLQRLGAELAKPAGAEEGGGGGKTKSTKQRRQATEPSGCEELDRIRAQYGKMTTTEVGAQFRSTIIWTTPLRMPIVQPYRKSGTKVIKTHLQDLVLKANAPWDPVHRRKQLQAFPPNFIHSLDASHMMLSALECDASGLTFAAVHDSFWTHASDIKTMNRILRDAFVRIHSDDVIGRLAEEFEARYRGSVYMIRIPMGSKAAQKVLEFRKRTRSTLSEELLLEKRRMELLGSADEEERALGARMETPGSIYELLSPNDEDMVSDPEDMPVSMTAVPKQVQQQLTSGSSSSSSKLTASGLPTTRDGLAMEEEQHDDEEAREDELDVTATDDLDAAAEPAEEDVEDGAGAETGSRASEARMDMLMGTSHFDCHLSGLMKQRPVYPRDRTISVWVPLRFPPIPKKGDFDVSRLKSSEYFFS